MKVCSKEDEELPHELFLTLREKTEIRNAFANKVYVDRYKLKYLIKFNLVDLLVLDLII